MVDLSCNIGGLALKNPIIIASGPLTSKLDRLKQADENGAAAVCLKHSLMKQKFLAKPRWYAERGAGVIVSGDPRLEVGEAQELIRSAKEQTGLVVIANMSGLPTDLDSWGELAKMFQDAGADAVELNMNCPNLHTAQEKGPTLGANLGQDPASCAAVLKNIKQKLSIPVIAKLPTEGGRLPQVSKSCDEAGVDILNIHAGFRAAPGLDIYHGGIMRYPGTATGPLGGFSGPWSRLISNRFIADVARSCKAPIMGGGGISRWEHMVESIMYGAAGVQICTAVMTQGFPLVATMLQGLAAYMNQMGYETLQDFRGMAIQHICGPGEMEYNEISAHIDPDMCRSCGKCAVLPTCDAIAKTEKVYAVEPELCVGCGLCAGICAFGAISFA